MLFHEIMVTYSCNACLIIYSNSIAEGQSMTQECGMCLFLASSVTMGMEETMDSGRVEGWSPPLPPHTPASQELWHLGSVWAWPASVWVIHGTAPCGPFWPSVPSTKGLLWLDLLSAAQNLCSGQTWLLSTFQQKRQLKWLWDKCSSCGKCQDSSENMGNLSSGRCQV